MTDAQLAVIRERVLSLAADFDRAQRRGQLAALAPLADCLRTVLHTRTPDRAERVQMLLSDRTPAPPR